MPAVVVLSHQIAEREGPLRGFLKEPNLSPVVQEGHIDTVLQNRYPLDAGGQNRQKENQRLHRRQTLLRHVDLFTHSNISLPCQIPSVDYLTCSTILAFCAKSS